MTHTTVHHGATPGNPAEPGPTAPDLSSFARLDGYGVVAVRGVDAAHFLHNQLTNPVEDLATGQSVCAAYCNPKGRVIALLRLLRVADDALLMWLPAELVEPVVRRLRMFVLRAKVVFEPLDARVFATTDAGLATPLSGGQALPPAGTGLSVAGNWLVNTGRDAPRYQYLAIDDGRTDPPAEAGDAEWLEVLAADAVPEVFAATSESFLPQAINLDRLDAVNFRKGCYPGQEIVARLRYLGKLKQRMVRVAFRGDAAAGDVVMAGEAKIGQLVLVGGTGEQRLGLASVNFAQLDAATTQLADGTAVAVWLPPYPVEELAPAS